jgi:NAD(P)-dependent dehydrogenase (short-subunit alcohol dehydrogenase family)
MPLLAKAENANAIYITSYDGVKPVPDYIAYCTGTAAMLAFASAMALYLPKFGIRVNCISPGATKTPLWDKLGGEDDSMWAKFAEANPMSRISTVDDVANAVMLVVNDPSGYLNGNNLYVDGGSHLRQA